jgi:hypothetical protein
MKVVFQGVSTENVVRGKSRYTKATVDYTYNGEARKQTIMSFANPGIFKQVQELQAGTEIEVTTGKNEAGFTEWTAITIGDRLPSGSTASAVPSSTGVTRVTGSNYESKEERAARQVLIVKQSSLGAAVESLTPGAKAPLDRKAVLELAQFYVDWVFGDDSEEDTEVV